MAVNLMASPTGVLFDNPIGQEDPEEDSQDPRLMIARSLMRTYQEGALAQGQDPVAVAEANLSKVPLGRRILADFMVGFANNYAGAKLKTTRETLVEREILGQQMKAQQQRSRAMMLESQLKLIQTMEPDQKQRALAAGVEKGLWTKDDALREMAGVPAPKAATPPTTFEGAAVQDALAKGQDINTAAGEFKAATTTPKEIKPTTIKDILDDPTKVGTPERDRAMKAHTQQIFLESKERQRAEELYKEKPDESFQAPGSAVGLALSSAYNTIGAQISSKNQREAIKRSLEDVAKLGDTPAAQQEARDRLTAGALEVADTTARSTVSASQKLVSGLNRIKELMAQLPPSVAPSLLTGSVSAVAEKLGTVRDPQLSRVSNELKSLLLTYITERSGKQFTDKEREFIASTFPRVNANMQLNTALIDGQIAQALDSYGTGLRNAMGSTAFNKFFTREINGEMAIRIGDKWVVP